MRKFATCPDCGGLLGDEHVCPMPERGRCRRAIVAAGVKFDYFTLHPERAPKMIVIRYDAPLTFEMLDRLSSAFQTREIDIDIDRGCPSDPSVDPNIVIRNPVLPP